MPEDTKKAVVPQFVDNNSQGFPVFALGEDTVVAMEPGGFYIKQGGKLVALFPEQVDGLVTLARMAILSYQYPQQ